MHAEGDGGHHHDTFFAQKAVLVAAAHFGVQPRVIGQCVDAFGLQPVGGFFHLLSALAIHHAGIAFVFITHKTQQLLFRLVLLNDGVADVGPVKAGHKQPRCF